MYLIDANILVYLFRKDSPSHQVCSDWFTETLGRGYPIFTTAIAEVALVRVTTLPSLGSKAAPLKDVFKFLGDLHTLPTYQHISMTKSVLVRWKSLCDTYSLHGNDVNDAYLAALALEHSTTLVSLDKRFGRFKELSWFEPS